MSKIVIVSERIHSTAWSIAKGLRAQQHEVTLLTSYGEVPLGTENIQVMAFFKKWSVFEGIRIISGLLGMQENVVHLILEKEKLNPAQLMISAFAKTLPDCILTTTLLKFDTNLTKKRSLRFLVENSDIVTCPSSDSLSLLRGLNIKNRHQGRCVLGPVLDFSVLENHTISGTPYRFNETTVPRILIPFEVQNFEPESNYFQSLALLGQNYHLTFVGSLQHWPLRKRKKFESWLRVLNCNWNITAPEVEFQQGSSSNRQALYLAGQNFSPVRFSFFISQAIKFKIPIVLDNFQTNVYTGLWRHGKNCWILDSKTYLNDVEKLLKKNLSQLTEVLDQDKAVGYQIVDNSLNELNRLYNKALLQLR